MKMLERKRTEMQMKVHETYDNAIKRTTCFKEGLQALYETLDKIKQAEIRVDIDQLNLNRAIEFRVREIENEMELQVNGNELDLINSRFVQDPCTKIERALTQFDFFPIQQQMLVDVSRMFSSSKIIKADHVTVDFLTEIMPVNHTVVRAELLYQHSTVMNNAKQAFQRWERLQAQAEKKAKKDGKTADVVKMPKDVQFDAPQRFH